MHVLICPLRGEAAELDQGGGLHAILKVIE
jgi:hypothetical protein